MPNQGHFQRHFQDGKRTMLGIGRCLLVAGFFSIVSGLGAEKTGPASAAPAESQLEDYSWSDKSSSVRLPKALLDRLQIKSVTITNSATMNFCLTPQFIATFFLNSNEVARINASLTNALHHYRVAQGKHFEPLDDDTVFARGQKEEPYPSGSFRFRLKPFQEEALAIRQKLEGEVLQTLGEDRARFFWRFAWLLPGEFNITNHASFEGTTYSFRLLKDGPGPLVDINNYASGGYSGRPYGTPLDLYAPEKLKPILARWREWIAEQPPASFEWSIRSNDRKLPKLSVSFGEQKWNETAPYVDLPKDYIPLLEIPGLTEDERISPEAIVVFSLSDREVKAINEAYAAMNGRVEQLESAHFERPDPAKQRFVLRAFPQRMEELNKEWLSKLQEAVGLQRVELLDESIRTRENAFARNFPDMRERHNFNRRRGHAIPRWYERGLSDIRIEVTRGIGPNGTERHEFRFESDRGGRGASTGSKLNIPDRFKHLITPETLQPLPLNL